MYLTLGIYSTNLVNVCVLTVLHLGPILPLDPDVFKVDVAIFEEKSGGFGETSAIEVCKFVQWCHCRQLERELTNNCENVSVFATYIFTNVFLTFTVCFNTFVSQSIFRRSFTRK